jgi:hypothetical protein
MFLHGPEQNQRALLRTGSVHLLRLFSRRSLSPMGRSCTLRPRRRMLPAQKHIMLSLHHSDPYPADPDDIRGDRPMSIEWTRRVPLPARFFTEFSVLLGQA